MISMRSMATVLIAGLLYFGFPCEPRPLFADDDTSPRESETAKAMFAGGCFWSVESDMVKAPGVLDVVVGYAGGQLNNPTYQTYAFGGHREVVLITYDPQKITFSGLIEFFIKHIDPTDAMGSFKDRGRQYSPAIFVQSEEEKEAAINVLTQLNNQKVFRRPLAVEVLPPAFFWPAEAYHQDYAANHAREYKRYRRDSGRDSFIKKHWKGQQDELQLAGAIPAEDTKPSDNQDQPKDKDASGNESRKKPWESFEKPSRKELRTMLTRSQFSVTQGAQTEPAFRNEYWNNHQPGIYVDIVSGEPLFSSTHKYDSGTGWPTFAQPLEPSNLVTAVDHKMGYPRVEVRSKHGDCHLGHVFNDGPAAFGGLRFCLNSAALRFIPKDELEAAGYGEYLKLFR